MKKEIPDLINMIVSKLHAHDYEFDDLLRFEELFIEYESIRDANAKSTLEFGLILKIYDEGNKSKDGKLHGSTNIKYLTEIGVGIKFEAHKHYIWQVIRRREILGHITDDMTGRNDYLDRENLAHYLKELFPMIEKLRTKILENKDLLSDIADLEKSYPELLELEKKFEDDSMALRLLEVKLLKARNINYTQSKNLFFEILNENASDYSLF